MADDVQVRFGASIEGAIAGIKQVTEQLGAMTAPITELQEAFRELTEVFAAAFAVEKIAEFTEAFANLGTQTQRTATMLGISASEVSGYDILAKSTGGSIEGVTMSMERMAMMLNRSHSAASPASAALKELGITAKELQSLPLEGKLELLADKFSGLNNSLEKDALAMALGGRAFQQMIPIFNQGGAAIAEFQNIAERSGSSMSGPQKEAAERLHMSILELSASYTGVKNTIATLFEPALNGIIKVITDLLQAFNSASTGGDTMGVVMRGIATAADGLATALVIAVAALETLWTMIKAFATGAINSFELVGRVIYDAFTLNYKDIAVAQQKFLDVTHDANVRAAADMTTTVKNMMAELKTIWATGAEQMHDVNLGGLPKRDAKGLDIGGNKQAAAQEALQAQLQAVDAAYRSTQEHLAAEVKLHQITYQEETKELELALSQRLALELDIISQEQRLYDKGSKEYQKFEDEKTAAIRKAAAERQKIEDKAAEESMKTWDKVGNEISSAIASQNKALLSGQETFADAFKNIFADMALKAIAAIEKIIVEDFILKGIEIALFPPAGLPHFDQGTDMITRSGLAMVHAGEQIVPANSTGPYTGANGGGSSGSGAQIAFNVSAIDASSVQAFFAKFGRQIANQLAPHLGQPSLT